ncbi:PREDICTED: S-norcoclaurine synthase 1-like [Prunus mume]|uniref:S-norcoclaurine synthase 1-like n=1 Tax=Prunus mume TaxID=102107 RepID=A0ABM0P575_PRUMU|nr:PREDICTED: S-norcoclaurine synthase 1-like [Prunus mume]
MAIGQVLHELEVNVSASEAWDLYGSLELAKFVEQALPNMIDKVELIQGDGGVGTILKVTFASGSGVHKEKFTKVDHEKRVKEVEVIEGGLLEFGLSLYRVRFEIIDKVEADYSSCCCIIKTTIEFDVKEDAAPNTSSLVSIDPFKIIAEVAKTHLLNKQSRPLPRPT